MVGHHRMCTQAKCDPTNFMVHKCRYTKRTFLYLLKRVQYFYKLVEFLHIKVNFCGVKPAKEREIERKGKERKKRKKNETKGMKLIRLKLSRSLYNL